MLGDNNCRSLTRELLTLQVLAVIVLLAAFDIRCVGTGAA
jgi:hypothetical protein